MSEEPSLHDMEADMDALAVGFESVVFKMLPADGSKADEFEQWQWLFTRARLDPHNEETHRHCTKAFHDLLTTPPTRRHPNLTEKIE